MMKIQTYSRNLKNKNLFYVKTIPIPFYRKLEGQGTSIAFCGSGHGWHFDENNLLANPLVISVGLGEDASFDVDFINNYKAQVVILDPTPAAIKYFKDIQNRFGCESDSLYNNSGRQPVNAYDLRFIDSNNMKFMPKALWTHSGSISFYPPSNPEHVSYSITNLQSTKKKIQVECTSYIDLLNLLGIEYSQVSIVKLDVEGAACEILEQIFSMKIVPRQILVELEEFTFFNLSNLLKLIKLAKILKSNNFTVVHHDYRSNFVFQKSLKNF